MIIHILSWTLSIALNLNTNFVTLADVHSPTSSTHTILLHNLQASESFLQSSKTDDNLNKIVDELRVHNSLLHSISEKSDTKWLTIMGPIIGVLIGGAITFYMYRLTRREIHLEAYISSLSSYHLSIEQIKYDFDSLLIRYNDFVSSDYKLPHEDKCSLNDLLAIAKKIKNSIIKLKMETKADQYNALRAIDNEIDDFITNKSNIIIILKRNLYQTAHIHLPYLPEEMKSCFDIFINAPKINISAVANEINLNDELKKINMLITTTNKSYKLYATLGSNLYP
jgi:hypothetical protein